MGTTTSARASARSAATVPATRDGATAAGETIEQCVLRNLDQYFAALNGAKPHALHEMVMTAVERPLLEYAMQRTARNKSAAAELLGINRNTLQKKLQLHGLLGGNGDGPAAHR